MNFSESKSQELSKKCQARAFKVNTGNKNVLFDQIASSDRIKKGVIVEISKSKHLKIKDFITYNRCHYLHFTLYNPKEKVSISPKNIGDNDLIDIENMDSLHAFMLIEKNTICALMQISTNYCESKIATIFNHLGLEVIPTAILKKSVIERIRKDGFRALHVNVSVDESDFIRPPQFFKSMIRKEPALKQKGIHGHLKIDARGNSELARSIENNTAVWVDDLDSDFYLETKAGEILKGDDLKIVKTYYAAPYGSKTILPRHAKEILDDFIANEI